MATREGDHVDEILSEWRRVYPSVDASPIGITGRVTRIALYTERSADDHLERYRLTPSGFEVLLALHGSAGHQLSPTLLARGQWMSSAGITGLVDQLVALGLAARSRERHDRRRVQVSLTHRGSEMVAMAGTRLAAKPAAFGAHAWGGLRAFPRSAARAIGQRRRPWWVA